jgi:protein-S-isoprenylcysteine O-methyltransferase Ste14
MPSIIDLSSLNPKTVCSDFIALLCVLAIFVAVLIDFVEFHKRNDEKKEKKSVVETGTMTLFFFVFYLTLRFGIGNFALSFSALKIFLIAAGLAIMIFSAGFNIYGRLSLGKNWANQIKIYSDHVFVSSGAYRLVRHPLYASIIWMFFGASLVYANYAAFFLNLLVFTPFMYYRARQEENLLVKEFKNYNDYQKKVRMFFPGIF